ncbi:hypothetical protein BDP55DRAFT_429019 [Colletotrichum godetiae]|uniref:Secreted protein n=1 Tax=Colletotrichum godetiae TaxID=1209918 RepID=A0AAJ0F134_9PEZI|nr:uncharacterized protein BDP55DRAFT_429019 [Colletotrichum godetiae]KAK1689097.1 hypothetical protein BDP55DRAFT_429019 [Colletotrichum godetiae]
MALSTLLFLLLVQTNTGLSASWSTWHQAINLRRYGDDCICVATIGPLTTGSDILANGSRNNADHKFEIWPFLGLVDSKVVTLSLIGSHTRTPIVEQ